MIDITLLIIASSIWLRDNTKPVAIASKQTYNADTMTVFDFWCRRVIPSRSTEIMLKVTLADMGVDFPRSFTLILLQN